MYVRITKGSDHRISEVQSRLKKLGIEWAVDFTFFVGKGK